MLRWRSCMYSTRYRTNQTTTGFLEIGLRVTVNIGDPLSTGDSTFRYKDTSLWESGPLPILTLLLRRFVVVVLFFDSLLLADAITSGDSLLFVTTATNSFSLSQTLVVWVAREARVTGGSPFFFWSFNSSSYPENKIAKYETQRPCILRQKKCKKRKCILKERETRTLILIALSRYYKITLNKNYIGT